MSRTSTAAIALSLALGCSAPQRAPAPPAPTPPPPVANTTASASAEVDASVAAPAPVVELTSSDAQALLDAWLRAQNGGDFAAYEHLYAPRFTGVRRSGPRVRQFDRAGWMTDRRTMFGAAMEVTARDVAITSGTSSATVRFTQDFTQGSFHDSGPKELVLVRAGASLVVAREEMLASTLGGAAQTPTAPAPGALMHVVSHGGSRWLLLASAPADGSWSRGEPALVDRNSAVVVTRTEVNAETVPAALRGMQGQAVRAYAGGGAACEARVGELAVLGRVDVHFGVEQRWSGQGEDGAQGAPLSDAVVAREAWSEADGGMVLAARLEEARGCAEVVWARVASQSAAAVFAPTTADAALAGRALARFRALPAWRRLQTDYRAEAGAGANWDAHGAGNAPTVTVWQAAGSARRFVTVRASTAVGGCAQFMGRLTAVFEVGGPTGLVLQSDGADPGAFVPTAAVDVDADGVPEFVTADGYVRRTGAVFRGAAPYAVPMRDCDC